MMALSSMDILIFDAEANGLLEEADTIWTIQVKPLGVPVWDWRYSYEWPTGNIHRTLMRLNNAPIIAGHNIIGYDVPLLKELKDFRVKGLVLDTLVLSRLLWPDRPGGHSIESWGKRLGLPKGDFGEQEGFKEWNPKMVDYCRRDVKITEDVLEYLLTQEETSYEERMGIISEARAAIRGGDDGTGD